MLYEGDRESGHVPGCVVAEINRGHVRREPVEPVIHDRLDQRSHATEVGVDAHSGRGRLASDVPLRDRGWALCDQESSGRIHELAAHRRFGVVGLTHDQSIAWHIA